MEKWKIAVIVLLLGLPVAYKMAQESSEKAGPAPSQMATPEPEPKLEIVGKPFPAWPAIKPEYWVNTKAPLALGSIASKATLVEVFRTGCYHCEEMAPMMEGIFKRYGPRGLQIVAFQSPSTNSEEEKDWPQVKQWIKNHGIHYPVAFDEGGTYFQDALKGNLFPSVYLLDGAKKVSFAQTGDDARKGLRLAVTLERTLPGNGEASARAKDLGKWLRQFTHWSQAGTDLETEIERLLKDPKAELR